jgi:transcriptional regulator with XRE-family HTH domain
MTGREKIRDLRNRLNITMQRVEDYSRQIAELENNEEFLVSTARLTQIENTDSIPSIFKLFSLSVVYRTHFIELLSAYGVDLERISKYQALLPLPQTTIASLSIYDEKRLISFPIRFDPAFKLDHTVLFSRMVEQWGEIPISLVQHLNVRKGLYGYIGSTDRTMYPLLRPGSFVQIDDRITTVMKGTYRSEFERPIYFLELRDGYACSWCEVQNTNFFLVPHPLSGAAIRIYQSRDVEVIGQVAGVAMRFRYQAPDTDAPRSLGQPQN